MLLHLRNACPSLILKNGSGLLRHPLAPPVAAPRAAARRLLAPRASRMARARAPAAPVRRYWLFQYFSLRRLLPGAPRGVLKYPYLLFIYYSTITKVFNTNEGNNTFEGNGQNVWRRQMNRTSRDVERDRGDAIPRSTSSRRSKEGWSTRIEQVRPRESEKEHPVASVVSLSSFTFEGRKKY